MEAVMRKTATLFEKDLKDVVKNPTMLVCCLLPLGFIAFFSKVMGGNVEGVEAQHAFDATMLSYALLFTCTMVSSMATITAIAEEKEKHTLRTLMLANVSPEQILLSRGLVALIAIAVVDAACYLVLGQPLAGLPAFLAIGVDELSVTPRSVLPLRNAVRMTDTRESSERILSDLDSDYTAR